MTVADSTNYPGSELHLFRDAHHWKEYLRAQLAPFLSGDILEVGAGLGAMTRRLHQPHHASWTCLEPDLKMAETLRGENLDLRDKRGEHPHVVQGTLDDLTAGQLFDTIVYVDVLEHIEQDADELLKARSRLREQGRLVVLSPAMPWLYSPFDASIGHFRRYTKKGLIALAPPDMVVVCARYLDTVGVMASLTNRLLLRSNMPTEAQIAVWDRTMVPLSRRLDRWLGYRAGKSILVVLER